MHHTNLQKKMRMVLHIHQKERAYTQKLFKKSDEMKKRENGMCICPFIHYSNIIMPLIPLKTQLSISHNLNPSFIHILRRRSLPPTLLHNEFYITVICIPITVSTFPNCYLSKLFYYYFVVLKNISYVSIHLIFKYHHDSHSTQYSIID
jgi:hypothetical protein